MVKLRPVPLRPIDLYHMGKEVKRAGVERKRNRLIEKRAKTQKK